jgi:hypothetical protein
LTRVYAEKNTWKRVYQDLKSRGFSLAKINEKIGHKSSDSYIKAME